MSERHARVAVAAIFFLYVLYIRVYDIADTFLMLGEQTRDWSIALGGITDLPLTGAPSTAGGRGFGPVYYWILWLGRHLVGPFTDYLPHAGGVTVALLQSAPTHGCWSRCGAALVRCWRWPMCLTIASAPFDIAISSVIWNPPVAAALIKMATAMALQLGEAPPRWKIAITAMLAWFAVQAHLSAIFVAAPLLALVATDLQVRRSGVTPATRAARYADKKVVQDRLKKAAMTAALVAIVVLALQIPYFIAIARDPAAPMGPTNAINTITNTNAIRIDRSYSSIVNGTGEVLVRQFDSWRFQIPTFIAALVVAIRWRRDLMPAGGIDRRHRRRDRAVRHVDARLRQLLVSHLDDGDGADLRDGHRGNPATGRRYRGLGWHCWPAIIVLQPVTPRSIDRVLQIPCVSHDAHRLV